MKVVRSFVRKLAIREMTQGSASAAELVMRRNSNRSALITIGHT